MEVTLDKLDLLRERFKLSYREAREILAAAGGDIIEALVAAEKRRRGRWSEQWARRSDEALSRLKQMACAGRDNHVRIRRQNRTLLEVPAALGAAGAVLLPEAAVLGLLLALYKDCTVEWVRDEKRARFSAAARRRAHPGSWK